MGIMLLDAHFLKKLEHLKFVFRRQRALFEGEGPQSARRGGGMIEFRDYKKYSPGNDYRYIDWNVYSRIGQLFIKEFSKEESVLINLLLDKSGSMSMDHDKWINALQLAAAFSFVGLGGQNKVRIWTSAGGGLEKSQMYISEGHVKQLFDFLEGIAPGGGTDLAGSLKKLGARLPVGSFVLVISDFLDESPVKEVLRLLRARRFEIAAVQLLSLEEWEPGFAGASSAQDVETGEEVAFYFDEQARGLYMKALSRLQDGWRHFCIQHGLSYHLVRKRESSVDSVLRFLARAGVHK
ncbi:DUF58 domain-containing protein [Planctomycetota bacterium]